MTPNRYLVYYYQVAIEELALPRVAFVWVQKLQSSYDSSPKSQILTNIIILGC